MLFGYNTDYYSTIDFPSSLLQYVILLGSFSIIRKESKDYIRKSDLEIVCHSLIGIATSTALYHQHSV